MSKEKEIKKGMLSEKMSAYRIDAPESAWKNISSRLPGRGRRRYLYTALAAAAGLALAVTVSLNLIDRTAEVPLSESVIQDSSEVQNAESEKVEKVNQDKLGEEQVEEAVKTDAPGRLEKKVQLAVQEVLEEMETKNHAVVPDEEEVIAQQLMSEEDGMTPATLKDTSLLDPEDELHKDEGEREDPETAEPVDPQAYLDSIKNETMAEEDLSEKVSRKRWQLGAALSPLYSYRNVSSPDEAQTMATNDAETGMITYSGAINLSYLPTDRLSFESGVYYNRIGIAIGEFSSFRSAFDFVNRETYYTNNNIVSMTNSIGVIESSNEDVFINNWVGGNEVNAVDQLDASEALVEEQIVNSFLQSFHYLEIPFNVKYKILDKKLQLLLVGGLSTNFLVSNSVIANTTEGRLDYGNIQDIRKVNYSGNAGLGFVYAFPSNISLSLEPRFRYYLNSVNEEYLPVTRPYTFGIYTGLNYSF